MPRFLQALARLIETDEAAKQGQHQFLSGLLYNLAKVLAADQPFPSPLTQLQAAGYSCGELCLPRCSALQSRLLQTSHCCSGQVEACATTQLTNLLGSTPDCVMAAVKAQTYF